MARDWVSATATRNYLLRDPLVDWLAAHGRGHGFVPDNESPDYVEGLEFAPFIWCARASWRSCSRGALSAADAAIAAPELGGEWHYVLVDAKFTTLHLSAAGQVGNGGSAPAYKGQLFIYNRALGNLQGYAPERAFLLGRGRGSRRRRA